MTTQLSAVVAELEDAQAAVDDAQASVSSLEAELSSARGRLDELTALLGVQTQRLERLRAEYEKAIAILDARVRSAYIDEPPDMLAFLVSASSFDDVIDNLEFLTVSAVRIGASPQVERAREDGCGATRDDLDEAAGGDRLGDRGANGRGARRPRSTRRRP